MHNIMELYNATQFRKPRHRVTMMQYCEKENITNVLILPCLLFAKKKTPLKEYVYLSCAYSYCEWKTISKFIQFEVKIRKKDRKK